MDDAEYSQKLLEYEQRVRDKRMESNEYDRVDYTESQYFWPEYLDYCAQWQHNYEYQAEQHLHNFIVELAKRKVRIECGDHYHEMRYHHPKESITKTSQSGLYITISHTTIMEKGECWYRLIRRQALDADGEFQAYRAAQLPAGMIDLYGQTTHLAHLMRDTVVGDTPYDAFTHIVYHRGPSTLANALARTSQTLYTQLQQMRKIPHEPWLRGTQKPHVLHNANELVRDHAFHAFIKATFEKTRWINYINRIRAMGTNFNRDIDHIHLSDIEKAMRKCDPCIRNTGNRSYSLPGIYYAPPGNGKSTSLRREDLVAFDTDWMTSCLHWTDIADLLYEQVPIITNQYTAFTGSQQLMVGYFNDEHKRLDEHGKPYTDWSDVEQEMRVTTQLLVANVKKKAFMNRDCVRLMFLQYIRNASINRFMLRKPPKIHDYWSDEYSPPVTMG